MTLVTWRREDLFGAVVDGEMVLNPLGEIVRREWFKSAEIRANVELREDEFVVMPNHVHGIIVLTDSRGRGDRPVAPTTIAPTTIAPTVDEALRPRGPVPQSIGAIMAGFKSAVTKCINEVRQTPGVPVWQRNYYEHIIRGQPERQRIGNYILNNPHNWENDDEKPDHT